MKLNIEINDPHCHILLRQQSAEPLCSPECFQRAAHGRIVIHGSFSKIFTPGHDTRKWWWMAVPRLCPEAGRWGMLPAIIYPIPGEEGTGCLLHWSLISSVLLKTSFASPRSIKYSHIWSTDLCSHAIEGIPDISDFHWFRWPLGLQNLLLGLERWLGS